MTMTDEPIVMYQRIDESPFSASTTDNWVARAGGLPPYIRGVVRGIEKSGHPFEEALPMAISVMKIWATGHNPWSKGHTGHVHPDTQAKAAAALAHWEAMKAAAHGNSRAITIVVSEFDGVRTVDGSGSGKTTKSGSSNKSGQAQSQQQQKSAASKTAGKTASKDAKQKLQQDKEKRQQAKAQAAAAGTGTGKGDHAAGHPFYGNQHSAGTGANPTLAADAKKFPATNPTAAGAAVAASSSSGSSSTGTTAAQAAQQQQQALTAVESAKTSYDDAEDSLSTDQLDVAQAQQEETQDVAFALAKGNSADKATNTANDQAIAAVQLSSTDRIQSTQLTEDEDEQKLKDAQATLENAMKNAGYRGVDTRDGFVGEGNPAGIGDASGAANFLPAGPTPAQAKAVDAALEGKSKHRFRGGNLTSCASCGQPITAPVHQLRVVGPKTKVPVLSTSAILRHVRHAGPGHHPVQTGHIKGVPARHRKAAAAANQKNYTQVEGPLQTALAAHFEDQRHSTISRLMGKRGGRLLKRSSEEQNQGQQKPRRIAPPPASSSSGLPLTAAAVVAAGYAAAKKPKYPQPGDDTHTTEEWSTVPSQTLEGESAPTSVVQQMKEDGESVENAPIQPIPDDVEADTQPPETAAQLPEVGEGEGPEPTLLPDVDPSDIFDPGFWANKTEQVVQPHLNIAGILAQNEVKNQVGLPIDTDDSSSLGAVQSILKRRAAEIAQTVTGTTAKQLADALQQGVANGEGRDAIAARVNKVFDEASMNRAKMIAQTATIGAYNEAAHGYASNLPPAVVGKHVWLAHHDSRTRTTHRMADLQERPLNAPFIVGGSSMMYPGDVSAPPNEYINCRCSQAFLPPSMSYGPIQGAAQAYVTGLKIQKPTSPYAVSGVEDTTPA
jgi:hypothetical protein